MKPLLTLLLLVTAATASAGEGELRRCRAMTDAAQRLACYDALPLAPDAAPAMPTQAAATAANFGIDRTAGEAQAITSHIPGRFEGWSPNARLRLANGQVWQVVDDSRAFYNHLQDPKVTVRRAAMGSFMMEIEGARATPRVRRVE